MSVVTEKVSVADAAVASDERSAHRLSGMVIALTASLALWGAIGAGIWGALSLIG